MTRARRRGITILEVITSILVAVIGVFGVVAIIPFAVRQAEIGLNQEDSINAARNIQSRFETMGLKASNRWFNGDPTVVTVPSIRPGFGIDADVRVYCMDPIGISYYQSLSQPYASYRRFPRVPATFVYPAGFPTTVYDHQPLTGARPPMAVPGPGIPRITFLDRNNGVFSRSQSAQVFGYENDLVYKSGNQKAAPPAPGYFRNKTASDSGQILSPDYRRETEGNVTCMSFIVGSGISSNEYTMYTVVFRKRDILGTDRVFQVNLGASGINPVNTTGYGGGDVVVSELTTPGPDDQRIGRNDWIMMLNSNPADPNPANIRSLQFYRVVESYETPGGTTFSLQGGDFDFSNGAGGVIPTFLIYMSDVIAVYEHTFRFEAQSNWN